jgi:hypothetical protein
MIKVMMMEGCSLLPRMGAERRPHFKIAKNQMCLTPSTRIWKMSISTRSSRRGGGNGINAMLQSHDPTPFIIQYKQNDLKMMRTGKYAASVAHPYN